MRLHRLFVWGWLTVLITHGVWLYWYYPIVGHDNSFGMTALAELRWAWDHGHHWNIDFSPFRCLGLPVFSNPNSFIFSLYHVVSLLGPPYHAMAGLVLFGVSLSYGGSYLLGRSWNLSPVLAVLMAIAWCVQAWAGARLLVGHTTLTQLLLFPLLLWILSSKTSGNRWRLALVTFFWAHCVYSAAYYLILIGVPSLWLSAWLADYLGGLPTDSEGARDTRARRVLKHLALTGAVALVVTLPKIAAVMNFVALFPREAKWLSVAEAAAQTIPQAALIQIPWGRALAYTLANFFYPFPYDARALTGWWYGPWESFQFVVPGALYGALWILWKHRSSLPVKRYLISFMGLVAFGTVLTSGSLAPLFAQLPVYKSLHVNPRWSAILILMFFVWLMILLAQYEALQKRQNGALFNFFKPSWFVLATGLLVLPAMLFVDAGDLQINYRLGSGMDLKQGRLNFCYEPIFGYGLENFPLVKKAPPGKVPHWMGSVYADPRCYLQSGRCEPGRLLNSQNAEDADTLQKLLTYSLEDLSPVVRYGKLLSLGLYGGLLIAAVLGLISVGRRLWSELARTNFEV